MNVQQPSQQSAGCLVGGRFPQGHPRPAQSTHLGVGITKSSRFECDLQPSKPIYLTQRLAFLLCVMASAATLSIRQPPSPGYFPLTGLRRR